MPLVNLSFDGWLILSSLIKDKHGVVESIARILGAEGINCLYQSTYSSANILVSKSDIVRARRVLEKHGKQTSKASD